MAFLFPPSRSSGPLRDQSGLAGAADALYLAEMARHAAPLAVVCASAWDANRLTEELRWFDPALRVCVFPDWETLPYDSFSPHPDLISERLATLYQISRGEFDIAVVALSTALYRLAPPAFLAAHTFFLKQKDTLDEAAFRAQMALGGYSHVNQVFSPGEFSIRGGLIDLFPMGSPLPYRIDLFDNEIETLRAFDVDTQRSIYPVGEVRLLPAREFPLDEAGITRFRQNFRERFEGDPSKSKLYKDVSNGLAPAGIEYYLPLFFAETATLFDYLPAQTKLVSHGALDPAGQAFWTDAQGRHRLLSGDKDRPLLPPGELFLPTDAFFSLAKGYTRLDVEQAGDGLARPVPPISVDRREAHPVARLQGFIEGFKGTTLIVAPSPGRRETLHEYLAEHGLDATLCEGWADCLPRSERILLTHGPLAEGFVAADGSLAVITETELYAIPPKTRRAREARATQIDNLLRDLSELKPGDPVVHAQYGVGQYLGLVNMDLGDGDTEFLQLEYARGDKLYVPVANLHLISRYSGAGEGAAPLHKLGTDQWDKARRRAMQAARDTAAELLNLYALRAAREGHAFKFSPHDYEAFAEGFGYEETPDQAATIAAVMADMQSGKPMDRLVCGDVGFGKTEVALRAAFVAVHGGKQVAILAPTTLLAEQHYRNFRDRFADWPIRVEVLSRFKSPKETRAALDQLAAGTIDIVVGTHKLLQGDVKFHDLGLVIVDEEQRFGVRQKERLKALRAEVHLLTLTATPIPRTLNMAMSGLRELSLIATAPAHRLAVKTFIAPWDSAVLREAFERELARGGQVYFLHNEVVSIERMARELGELVPAARIRIAHGQMPERELEATMLDFHRQRFNVLVCTTIIESGIDIPSANTIIINRADRFGLAQLHQLRGRVGRSHHRAYAYLLVPPDRKAMTGDAEKRLEALAALEELGAGFTLATHDLEIRGAGELLGEEQSGQIAEIGFALYTELLERAVRSLKLGQIPDLDAGHHHGAAVELHISALIPDHYLPDVHTRLTLYKRIASARDSDALRELQVEMIDRFGLLPEPAKNLFAVTELKLAATALGIRKLDFGERGGRIEFEKQPNVDPMTVIRLIQSQPRHYRMDGPDKLRVTLELPGTSERLRAVRGLFAALQNRT